jgi:NADP-dependent 3-hydroxy acid dehydrogenase YdfG
MRLEGLIKRRGHFGEKWIADIGPYNLRTTVISPGAIVSELLNSVTEPDIAENIEKFYKAVAIPAESFA